MNIIQRLVAKRSFPSVLLNNELGVGWGLHRVVGMIVSSKPTLMEAPVVLLEFFP